MPVGTDLGDQLDRYVAMLVSSGRFGSRSEVLREGLRLLQEREARVAALETALERGIADANAGATVPAREVFDRLEAKYAAMAGRRG